MADRIIAKGVKGIAAGIGFASESIHAHNEKKRLSKSPHVSTEEVPQLHDHDHDHDREHEQNHEEHQEVHTDHDERQWELDDAQEELVGSLSPERQAHKDGPLLAADFIAEHPAPLMSPDFPPYQLPCPVVLPQRRPKDRTRGFIRAYAPALEPCGINQHDFMQFLATFDKSTAANPWLNAINLASLATCMLPTVTSIVISRVVQKITNVAIELQGRQRTNKFLEKINHEYYRPRGLYCLVMCWSPENQAIETEINLTRTISSSLNPGPNATSMDRLKHTFSDGTQSTFEIAETCPLVYPHLDAVIDSTDPSKKQKMSWLKENKAFVTSYMDRRAVAKFAGQNPDSVLAKSQSKPEFHSRYADPNHPASSGNPISLLTGGLINPAPGQPFGGRVGGGFGGGLGAGRFGGGIRGYGGVRGYGAGYGQDPYYADEYNYYASQSPIAQRQMLGRETMYQRQDMMYGRQGMGMGMGMGGGFGGFGGPHAILGKARKIVQKNVLYMMIVNMPSEEELAEARVTIAQIEAGDVPGSALTR